MQRGVGAIPKSARRAHLEENFDIFDFELADDELARIAALGRGARFVDPGWAPTWDQTAQPLKSLRISPMDLSSVLVARQPAMMMRALPIMPR